MINTNFDYSKVKGSTPLHNKFKKEFMISACSEFLGIRVIPYDVGMFRAYSEPDKIVRCGQVGVPDTIVFGNGWYEMFDMKTGGATFQKNQKNWQAQIKEINDGRNRVHKIKTVEEGLEIIRKNYE